MKSAFFIQQNTLEFLHQQKVLITTTIQPLEPSYTHKICMNVLTDIKCLVYW